ncbi:MAG: hypothetical protein E7363_00745 [Clostridiales bacterium]|nr:hypothetical protein [Clostridiales bacterium]
MVNQKNKFLTVIKIIFTVFYLAVTIWLIWGFLDILLGPTENMRAALAVYLAFAVIILGIIFYGICLVPALIGLIYSLVKKAGKGNVLFFTVAVFLPIITEGLLILLCRILG